MKTASIITVHLGANFGSNLQAIATSEVLKGLCLEPTIVRYIPPRCTWKRFWKGSFYPVTLLHHFYSLPNRLLNNRIYDGFLDRHCRMSEKILPQDDFAKVCPKADFYITGSDQIWNVKYNEGIDKHYFWDGIKGTKIAYAASIGGDSLSDEEVAAFEKYLPEYKAVSVRESGAKELLKGIGFEATHVLDPTLMLDRNVWKKYASPRIVKDPYILVYLPYNIVDKAQAYRSIRKIAKRKGLKVVAFSWGYWKDKYADLTIRYANPGDFLSLMMHADYVMTNSFHGTAFSINLNKQFWSYFPSAFTTRVTSVMDLCGVSRRVLSNEITDEAIDEAIDYEPVNKILDVERLKTLDFLKDALA